jgi:tetratricopeptide (TPR) repeat protein
MARHLEERYETLRQIRELGASPEKLAQVVAQATGDTEASSRLALVGTIERFIQSRTWTDSMRVVQAHPELLGDESEILLGELIEGATTQRDENAARILQEHRALLRHCREVGVATAFAEKMGLPPGVDPLEAESAARAAAALPEELGQELAGLIQREGISSPEEFQAALQAHPELRERLAQATQQAGGSGVPIPPEFASDVREMQDVLGRLQREPHLASQYVAILERMRARPEIGRSPEFKAGVLNDLGTAYAELPTGDRGANLGRAIECYQQALTVYTPEAAPLDYAMTQNNLGNAYLNLPTGDRGANLGRAIECYQQALRFRTPEAAPFQYATTQNNLGTAYSELPTGDRGANLGRAIECYQQALTV